MHDIVYQIGPFDFGSGIETTKVLNIRQRDIDLPLPILTQTQVHAT